MSLKGKALQAVDVFEFTYIDKATGATICTGNANSTSITSKNDVIDIFAGIGQKKIASLKTKKDTAFEGKLSEFNLEYMAAQSGVALNVSDTGTYVFDGEITVTELAATVAGATRVFGVKQADGTVLKMVSGAPAALNEVKVAGTALTFYTGFADTKVYVTYAAPAASGKENLVIKMNSRSFPKNGELICHTIVFDGETEEVVADAYANFYSVALNGDYTWTFDAGKNIETSVKFDVLTPRLLPDGTMNKDGDTGRFVVTER